MKGREWEEAKCECDFRSPTLSLLPWGALEQRTHFSLSCLEAKELGFGTLYCSVLGYRLPRSVKWGETQKSQVLPAHFGA